MFSMQRYKENLFVSMIFGKNTPKHKKGACFRKRPFGSFRLAVSELMFNAQCSMFNG